QLYTHTHTHTHTNTHTHTHTHTLKYTYRKSIHTYRNTNISDDGSFPKPHIFPGALRLRPKHTHTHTHAHTHTYSYTHTHTHIQLHTLEIFYHVCVTLMAIPMVQTTIN